MSVTTRGYSRNIQASADQLFKRLSLHPHGTRVVIAREAAALGWSPTKGKEIALVLRRQGRWHWTARGGTHDWDGLDPVALNGPPRQKPRADAGKILDRWPVVVRERRLTVAKSDAYVSWIWRAVHGKIETETHRCT